MRVSCQLLRTRKYKTRVATMSLSVIAQLLHDTKKLRGTMLDNSDTFVRNYRIGILHSPRTGLSIFSGWLIRSKIHESSEFQSNVFN